jgi:hypothetical protein
VDISTVFGRFPPYSGANWQSLPARREALQQRRIGPARGRTCESGLLLWLTPGNSSKADVAGQVSFSRRQRVLDRFASGMTAFRRGPQALDGTRQRAGVSVLSAVIGKPLESDLGNQERCVRGGRFVRSLLPRPGDAVSAISRTRSCIAGFGRRRASGSG